MYIYVVLDLLLSMKTLIRKYKTILILSVFLVGLIFPAHAQFNFGVGFSMNFAGMNEINEIHSLYNQNNSEPLVQGLSNVNFMNGVYLSLRQKVGNLAFEFSWENLDKDKQSVLVDNANNGIERKLFYSFTSTSLGVENHINQWGYGASIGRQKMTIKAEINNTDVKRNLVDQAEFSSRFFIMYKIQTSDFISLVLKPYIQVPLANFNLSGLELELLDANQIQNRTNNPILYGLTLIFYNGKQ